MRLVAFGVVVVLAGCGGGGGEAQWLDQFDVDSVETVDGLEVGVTDELVYVEDCDVARSLTAVGGRFEGLGFICP